MGARQSYEIIMKEEIKTLVEANLLVEAKALLKEYEELIENDVDIYSIKGIISMMEGNIDDAKRFLEDGLKADGKNFDLLWNLGYFYSSISNFKESYRFYIKALDNSPSEELKKEIVDIIIELENEHVEVLYRGKISVVLIEKCFSEKTIEEYIIDWFCKFGFTLVYSDEININEKYNGKEYSKIIALYDFHPTVVSSMPKKYNPNPNIDNGRYFLKEHLVDELYNNFKIDKGVVPFYYSFNEIEALKLLNIYLPKEQEKIINIIKCYDMEYSTKSKVLKIFDGFKYRAKTELIEYKCGLAVKKTWKPNNEKFMEREKYAYGILSKKNSLIPPLLDSGENYIIIPYYEDKLIKNDELRKVILSRHINEIASFFKFLYDEGYYNTDIHPGQFVFSVQHGLKAIDYEYLQKYDIKPRTFLESYDIIGRPDSFEGDIPNYIGRPLFNWYNRLWKEYTSYSLRDIAYLAIKSSNNKNLIDIDERNIKRVLSSLNYAKTSGETYSGKHYESAYHSMTLKGKYFRGQRECEMRLKNLNYDFNNKIVLDIGCNAGGMLHAISKQIKLGVGIDYDFRLINAANMIKSLNEENNLSFFIFDLEKENLTMIRNFILNDKVDICFLLSVCMWIENWKEVIHYTSSIALDLLFETNGTFKQQTEQVSELNKCYEEVKIINEVSDDDPSQKNRQLYLCRYSINYNGIK